jgi:hypothetical protein
VKKVESPIVSREIMRTFSEKIDNVLRLNEKDLHSLADLERHIGVGLHTLRKAYNENREPSERILKKLVEKMSINWDWWSSGKGEIFREKHTSVRESSLRTEATPKSQEVVSVRVVEAKAQAGYLRGYADPEYMETLPTIPVSMDDNTKRSICHGDVVLGRELYRQHWQSKLQFKRVLFIIVHPSEGIVFKEITAHNVETGEITCHSWNSEYEDFTLNLRDVKQLFYIKKIVERNINF